MEKLFSRKRRRGVTVWGIALPLAAGALVAAGGVFLGQYRQGGGLPSGEDASLVAASVAPEAFQTVFLPPEEVGRGSLLLVGEQTPASGQADLVSPLEEGRGAYQLRDGSIQLAPAFVEAFGRLAEAFSQGGEGEGILLLDGYRSLENQALLAQQADGTALGCQRAPSGCSDHHTGLAADLAWTAAEGGILDFSAGPWEWMAANAPDYGFVLDRTDSPGHLRYVGFPHSRIMADEGWDLGTYLEKMAAYSYDHPYRLTTGDGVSWRIYACSAREGGTDLPIPRDGSWQVSGDNDSRYVVTVRETAPAA